MSALNWIGTELPEGFTYSNDIAEEYEIIRKAHDKFYIRRVVADCDDIGPVATFEEAETIVLKIGIMLVTFEEQAWKILAAQSVEALSDPDMSFVEPHYFSEAVGGLENE